SLPSRWTAKVEELRALVRAGGEVSLSHYLEESGLEAEDVYDGGRSWSDLRAEVGIPFAASGPNEETLRRACGRLLHVDDRARLDAYAGFLRSERPPELRRLDPRERRVLRMLVASLLDKAVNKTTSLEVGCELLWSHPGVRREVLELLEVLAARVAHLHH